MFSANLTELQLDRGIINLNFLLQVVILKWKIVPVNHPVGILIIAILIIRLGYCWITCTSKLFKTFKWSMHGLAIIEFWKINVLNYVRLKSRRSEILKIKILRSIINCLLYCTRLEYILVVVLRFCTSAV